MDESEARCSLLAGPLDYFISYFYRRGDVESGFANGQIGVDQPLTLEAIRDIEGKLQAAFEFDIVLILNYIPLPAAVGGDEKTQEVSHGEK